MLLTVSSQGMHDWSRTDLTWQRNWNEKRGDMSCLDLCQVAGAGSPQGPGPSMWQEVCPSPFSWHPGLCSARRGSTHEPGAKHQADRKQLQGIIISQLIPLVRSSMIHLDRESILWALADRFYCHAGFTALLCTTTHTSCVSAWSLLKSDTGQGRSVQFMKDLWILGEKGNIHLWHSARLQQWLCTACSSNQTRNSSAKSSNKQWRCQQ